MDGEGGEKKSTFTCDMVIAKYKENLDWLKHYEKHEFTFRDVIVYNKAKENTSKTSKDIGCILNGKECIKINLPNVGRCDHTYLHHIIKNYGRLADVTIFTKGSSDIGNEAKKLSFITEQVFKTHDTVFSVYRTPDAIGHVHEKDMKMSSYLAKHPSNHHEIHDLAPASLRPFGAWFTKHFSDIHINYVSYYGIMAVSRAHIHHRSLSYYEKLIKELSGHSNPEVGHYKKLIKELSGHSNPEVGHYIERSWLAIFHPVPEECIYSDNSFHGGSRRRRITRKSKRRSKPL